MSSCADDLIKTSPRHVHPSSEAFAPIEAESSRAQKEYWRKPSCGAERAGSHRALFNKIPTFPATDLPIFTDEIEGAKLALELDLPMREKLPQDGEERRHPQKAVTQCTSDPCLGTGGRPRPFSTLSKEPIRLPTETIQRHLSVDHTGRDQNVHLSVHRQNSPGNLSAGRNTA